MIATAIKRLVQRPKVEQSARVTATLVATPRFSEDGYAVFENHKLVAWGRSQTAALASYEQYLAGKASRN